MLIGQDFEKMQFDFLGLHLLEPNALLGNTFIFVLSLILYLKIGKPKGNTAFFTASWRWFFMLCGLSFLVGGFGHVFYNYWGVAGKHPAWYLTILGVFFVERAMISLHPVAKTKALLTKISRIKLVVALLAALYVSLFVDLEADYSKGMIVPTTNSIFGFVYTLGILGYRYARTIPGFRYFWLSVIILFPAAFFQGLKISIHPWFDKNDAAHLLLDFSLVMYYFGVKAYKGQKINV